jgi:hypothetical protein
MVDRRKFSYTAHIPERRVRPRPRQKAGEMNKTEARYASEILDVRKAAGEIIHYRYERLKLKLAKKTFYTPDFIVITPDHLEIHEVKGFMEDDAAVKLKVAADQWPEFRFVLAMYKNKKTGWIIREVG